jgi:hypothetical protein
MASKWDGKPVRFEAVHAVVCCTNGNPASGSPANSSPVNGMVGRGTNGSTNAMEWQRHEWQSAGIGSFMTERVKVYLLVCLFVFNLIHSCFEVK